MGDARQDHRLDRSRDREGHRRQRRDEQDDLDRSALVHRHGRRDERQALEDVPDKKHPIAWEAVAGERGERCDEAGGNQLDEREEGCLAGSAKPIGVDKDRHPRGVLGHVEPEVGELDPGQDRVARNGQDDVYLFPHPAGA